MTTPMALTKTDLAERLQMSVRTIDRRRAGGEILLPLEGHGHPRWSAADVEAWIAAGTPTAAIWERHKRRRR